MNREEARREIKGSIKCTDYLEKSQHGEYICPLCGSGTHKNRSGALTYYPKTNTWHCFSCDQTGDVIDLYKQRTGSDYNTALSLMADQLGITIEPYYPGAETDPTRQAPRSERHQRDEVAAGGINTPEKEDRAAEREEMPTAGEIADYRDYYSECRARINDPEAAAYLEGRGISSPTAAACWIGYDPAADPANAPGATSGSAERKPHPCKRIIIPVTAAHYVARSIEPTTEKEYQKMNPSREKGAGAPGIFNCNVLYAQEVQAVFITESAFDALSVIEAGYPAIALNSAVNAQKLIDKLAQKRPAAAVLIVAPQKDARGSAAAQTIIEGLRQLNIKYITADLCAEYKDLNEYLVGSSAAFKEAVAEAARRVSKPDNTRDYINSEQMREDMAQFKKEIRTGFANLDEAAGGLYAGLYTLAAAPGTGKTTFALQMADQLAAAGHDVIFFSLEQARLELVSKSLARMMAQKDRAAAVSSIAIRKGYKGDFSRELWQAEEDYKEAVADRVSIIEGNFSCDISFIGNYVRRYIARNKARPVIFIDYLQILQPAENMRRGKREDVDEVVTALKQLSRDLSLTVIAICSINRSNYLTAVNYEAIKETGNIEFSCDVVWGLQLQCVREFKAAADPADGKKGAEMIVKEKRRDAIEEAEEESPRKMELICLKNRYGGKRRCYFDYYPENDLFIDKGTAPKRKHKYKQMEEKGPIYDRWADAKII